MATKDTKTPPPATGPKKSKAVKKVATRSTSTSKPLDPKSVGQMIDELNDAPENEIGRRTGDLIAAFAREKSIDLLLSHFQEITTYKNRQGITDRRKNGWIRVGRVVLSTVRRIAKKNEKLGLFYDDLEGCADTTGCHDYFLRENAPFPAEWQISVTPITAMPGISTPAPTASIAGITPAELKQVKDEILAHAEVIRQGLESKIGAIPVPTGTGAVMPGDYAKANDVERQIRDAVTGLTGIVDTVVTTAVTGLNNRIDNSEERIRHSLPGDFFRWTGFALKVLAIIIGMITMYLILDHDDDNRDREVRMQNDLSRIALAADKAEEQDSLQDLQIAIADTNIRILANKAGIQDSSLVKPIENRFRR